MEHAQLAEIADNLLREVVMLREDNKRLKEQVQALSAKSSEDELREAWQADEHEDCAEFFDIFVHAVREHEEMKYWKLDRIKYNHWMKDAKKWSWQ